MGQDSWNLQYGKSHPAKYRKGVEVDMHSDEGFGGVHMIPGYAGAYKNEKTRVLKANGNPKTYGSEKPRKGVKNEMDQNIREHRAKKRK